MKAAARCGSIELWQWAAAAASSCSDFNVDNIQVSECFVLWTFLSRNSGATKIYIVKYYYVYIINNVINYFSYFQFGTRLVFDSLL